MCAVPKVQCRGKNGLCAIVKSITWEECNSTKDFCIELDGSHIVICKQSNGVERKAGLGRFNFSDGITDNCL